MELNDIKIFLELYKTKSISKTAELLNYTQSNISTRLAKLEEEFHTPFFIRTKSGLEILPSAECFLKHAQEINDSLNNLYKEFHKENQHISIGSTQLLSRLYYPGLYKEKNLFHLYTVPVDKLHGYFHSKVYDIVITHTKFNASDDIYQLMRSEKLCWAKAASYTNDSNKDFRIIVNRDNQCPIRKSTLEAIHKQNLKVSVIEVDTLDLLLTLLQSTDSIALLPYKIIKDNSQFVEYPMEVPGQLNIFVYCHNKSHFDLLSNFLNT